MISMTIDDVNELTDLDRSILQAVLSAAPAVDGLALRGAHWDRVAAGLDAAFDTKVAHGTADPATGDIAWAAAQRDLAVSRTIIHADGTTTDLNASGFAIGGTVPGTIALVDNPATGAPEVVLTCETPDPIAALFAAGAPPLPKSLPSDQNPTGTAPPLPPPSSQTSTQPLTDGATGLPAGTTPPAPEPENASGGADSTSGVQTDSAGMLWDGRVHAGTKAKIGDGTWKKRRGVEAGVVAEVEAQLRAAAAIPAPSPAAGRLAPAVGWPFPTDSSSLTGGAPTFATLMTYITGRIEAKTLTQEQSNAAIQSVGLASINLVMARTDLIPAIMNALRLSEPAA